VDEAAIRRADLQAELAQGFEEGLALDVADGAADLGDGDIHGSSASEVSMRMRA
jgi:hypothetical protein